jgi:hypothetical protein
MEGVVKESTEKVFLFQSNETKYRGNVATWLL